MDLLEDPDNDRLVIWVGAPVMRPGSGVHEMDQLHYIYWSEAKSRPWIQYFDSWPFFSDGNMQYVGEAPFADGVSRGLRQKDGVHLSTIGGNRLSWAVLNRIGQYVDLSAGNTAARRPGPAAVGRRAHRGAAGDTGRRVGRGRSSDACRTCPGPVWPRDRSDPTVLDYHLSMLPTTARMASFRRAIEATVQPGDVVVDIGCGAGVLSFMACRRVPGRCTPSKADPVIELARELAIDNGFADRIEFLDGWSLEVGIPEPADVLVSETIGNAGFDEGIVAWAFDARQRLLRPGARLVPQRLRLWVAALESFDDHTLVSDWWTTGQPYDYSAAHRRAVGMRGSPTSRRAASSVSRARRRRRSEDGPRPADLPSGALQVDRDGTLHGLACWFDSLLSAGVTIDNPPPRSESSWYHGFLPLAQPLAVSAGSPDLGPDGARPTASGWTWRVERCELRTAEARSPEVGRRRSVGVRRR